MKLSSFSLRELFLLVVIAAMGCGWWVDHMRLSPAADLVLDQIRAINEFNADVADAVIELDGFTVDISVYKSP